MGETKPRLIRWTTKTEAEQWPDDQFYPDLRRGWVDVTTTEARAWGWTLLPHPDVHANRCRTSTRTPCKKAPAAVLWRTTRHKPPQLVPWVYCPEHMYGRIIEDGRVLEAWLLNPTEFPEVPDA